MKQQNKAAFITFEGIDGCGKSTQIAWLSTALKELGVDFVRLREPGGNAISEKVRALLLDPANTEMTAEAELLLYEASRAQNVRQAIEPALEAGTVVLCDRFFDSTFAYQAHARGLDEESVRTANKLGSCGFTPDVTIVFDLDPTVAWERATRGGADRLEAEGLAFQELVREGYVRAHELEPERVLLVDADGTRSEVFVRLVGALTSVLPALADLDMDQFLELQEGVEQAMATIAVAPAEETSEDVEDDDTTSAEQDAEEDELEDEEQDVGQYVEQMMADIEAEAGEGQADA